MYKLFEMLDFSLRYFRFFNFFLSAAILIASLVLTRNIVNFSFSEKAPAPSVLDTGGKGTVPERNIRDYAVILERNPFGPPMTLEPVAGPRPAEVKQYGPLSDLVLKGTAVGPERMSYAVIANKKENSGEQEIFTYGDEVFTYGTLTKIERDSVELTRDNVAYSLMIPVGEDTVRNVAVSAQASQIARKVGEREYLLDSNKVRQSLNNPEKLLTDARLLPNFVDGEQEGFRISEVKADGLYHELGLRNGDILLRINGLAISNPEVAIQAMSALKGMNRVDLDIIRNNERMSMSYRIR